LVVAELVVTREDDGGKYAKKKEDFGLLRRSEGALSSTYVPQSDKGKTVYRLSSHPKRQNGNLSE